MTAATGPDAAVSAAPEVVLRGVDHHHGEVHALDHLDLRLEPGSFVAVVGASGCGKSTLLRLLAGLDRPTRGTIALDGRSPDDLRRDGDIGWMAQRPALLPWTTVRDNVALARRIRPPARMVPDVEDLLAMVGLDAFAEARPPQLSGGMQQRAALARTLAQDASVWLMDEPFAALDELTREALAADLLSIWRDLRPTVVWVTHHVGEAVGLADRVLVLGPRPGRVVADLVVDLRRPREPTSADVQAVVRDVRDHLALAQVDAVRRRARP